MDNQTTADQETIRAGRLRENLNRALGLVGIESQRAGSQLEIELMRRQGELDATIATGEVDVQPNEPRESDMLVGGDIHYNAPMPQSAGNQPPTTGGGVPDWVKAAAAAAAVGIAAWAGAKYASPGTDTDTQYQVTPLPGE